MFVPIWTLSSFLILVSFISGLISVYTTFFSVLNLFLGYFWYQFNPFYFLWILFQVFRNSYPFLASFLSGPTPSSSGNLVFFSVYVPGIRICGYTRFGQSDGRVHFFRSQILIKVISCLCVQDIISINDYSPLLLASSPVFIFGSFLQSSFFCSHLLSALSPILPERAAEMYVLLFGWLSGHHI